MSGPDFTGKVALIAGASRGIGAETACAFASAGAAVALASRHQPALDAVAGTIADAGGLALAMATDIADAAAMERLVAAAVSRFGRLDYAFNNATDGPMPAPLADLDPDSFDIGIRTNIRGTFIGMKYQIPAMIAGGGGAIVNMASLAGIRAVSGLGAYVSGKAGIIGLTQAAALDYADRGIRINVVAPGPILTENILRAGPEAQRQAAHAVPMRRIGAASEVASAVLWLCSDAASFITGVTLPIDGGQSAGTKVERNFRPAPMQSTP